MKVILDIKGVLEGLKEAIEEVKLIKQGKLKGIPAKDLLKARQLADKINQSIKPGQKPSLDQIISEVNEVRSK